MSKQMQIACVAGAGAIGGVISWLFEASKLISRFPVLGQLLACAALGAVAAAIGVYFLTASDMTQVRTYVFGMICGLVWQPVISAGQRLVVNQTAKATAQQVDQKTKQITASIASDSPQELHAEINKTAQDVRGAVKMLNRVEDSAPRQQLLQSSQQALTALSSASDRAPVEIFNAITSIGKEAITSKQSEVATQAISNLGTIADQNPQLKTEAGKSLAELGIQAQQQNLLDSVRVANLTRMEVLKE